MTQRDEYTQPAENTSVDWDDLFTADVIAHRHRNVEGGLGEWEYSEPKFDGDQVNGAELWVDFLKQHGSEENEEYYIMRAEKALAERAAPKIAEIVEEPVAFALLGIGDAYALTRKDLRIVDEFTRVSSITAYDINMDYLSQAMRVFGRRYPMTPPEKHTSQIDVFKGFGVPRGKMESPKVVATMFGATLFNVEAERDFDGKLVTPKRAILTRLKAIRRSLREGDVFVTTHDGNKDKDKVEKAYAGQTEFATNLAHRINRDTPRGGGYKVDTDATDFRVEFDKASGVLGHYLTLQWQNNGRPEEYLVNISVKMTAPKFLELAKEAGFKKSLSMVENGVHLHALEAV